MKKLLPLVLILAGCSVTSKFADTFKTNPYKDDPASISRGERIFKTTCVSCHDQNGTGQGAYAKELELKPTNLVEYVKKNSDTNVAMHVRHGKFDTMPSFIKTLSEDEIWDVTNFLKTLSQK